MSWLCCTEGPDRGLQLELSDQLVTIGRSPENTVRLAEEKASRFHCQVSLVESHLEVLDLNSTNGTTFAAEKVRGQRFSLKLGDSFVIGKDRFEFRRGPDRAAMANLKTEQSVADLPLERGQAQTKYETATDLHLNGRRKSWLRSILGLGKRSSGSPPGRE